MVFLFNHSSMSSKIDGNYAHKKFKKATLEAYEKREIDVKLVTNSHKAFANAEDGLRSVDSKNELCECNGSSKCFMCLQPFHSKGEYLRHKVLLSNHVQNELPQDVKKVPPLLYRSISLPGETNTMEPNSKICEKEHKPIYKPKFRAQYHLEDASKVSEKGCNQPNSSLVSRANTYHDLSVSTYTSSDHSGPISGRLIDDVRKVNCDATNRPTSSQSLWKGIKSPSPELVGQHITNLIVQNKAIVETQKSLWPLRYKRQSSVGSVIAGECLSKTKRLSSEARCRNIYRSKSPHNTQVSRIDCKGQANFLPSHPTTHSTSCNRPVTTIKQIDYDAIPLTGFAGDSCYIKVAPVLLTEAPQSSNQIMYQNKPNISLSQQLSISGPECSKIEGCGQCGVLVESSNMLQHQKYNCSRYVMLEMAAKSGKLQQEEALDLQMKSCIIKNKQPTSDNEAYVQNMSARQLTDERKHQFRSYPYTICNISNPKLSINQQNVEYSNVSSNIRLSNGNIFLPSEYGARGIDELHKPKSSNHHIYGGEVKICDGAAFKTLKIDSIKSEKPSLDVCIASQQLGAKESSVEAYPPTSLIVKFATCGLNSGGTMVKIDNQKSRSATLTYNKQKTSDFYVAPEENNLAYKTKSTPLAEKASLTLIPLTPTKSVSPLSGRSKEIFTSSFNAVSDYATTTISSSSLRKALPYKQHPYFSKIRKDKCPVMVSIDVDNAIPHVPGIPGPYSQPNGVTLLRRPGELVSEQPSNSFNPGSKLYSDRKVRVSPIAFVSSEKTKYTSSPTDASTLNLLPNSLQIELQTSDNPQSPETSLEKESCFLVPRKRPSTLSIKPTQLNSKSSLIGSTLVSPDTPRPKKSCAQLLLNGSAYTYLNMKVSTKTFFCCIYRPQPMYVLQATNPKLSMYSNWQVRKTDDPLNLSPAKLMSLHQSGVYYDRSYTIANQKYCEMTVTASSSRKGCKMVPECYFSETSSEKSPPTSDGDSINRKSEDETVEEGVGKRVKIFEGGFKTNEDYTYVRGRGRGRYVCETCGIRCKKPSMLKKHIRTHTDLRPFACSHCSFSFKTKGNLTKHLKSKAHYKRCTEMGIRPVPTVVDETHINKEALELQGKIDLTINSCQSADDEDDSEDDNDESEDEEFDDFDDDERCTEGIHDLHEEGQSEGPIDLSVKRDVDKNKCPTTLILPAFHGGGTPGSITRIKENPSEILSPATESSYLLKSIYDTTLKVSKATEKAVTPEPGCGGSMLQKYLREIAVLDTARKRKYIKVTECQDLPTKRPRIASVNDTSIIVSCPSNNTTFNMSSRPSLAGDIAAAIVVSCETSNHDGETRKTACSTSLITTVVVPSKKRESSPIAYRNSPCHSTDGATHAMHNVPANMVVVNTSGTDSKAAFMSPSGVIPTSSNRPGCDDGKSKCSICQKEFVKQSQLSLHMNIHYIERPHRCESCGVSFRTNGHLQKHMRSVSHYNKLNMNMTFGTPSTENPRPFKCHDCKSAFRIHGHLAKHLRSKLHIMKLECLGKLPFGTYAEIERSGVSLNEIDTSDCENSLDSLQDMASKLYEKDPTKLSEWTEESKLSRLRTMSTSSNNSDEYPLEDDQDQKQAEDESESGFDDDLVEGIIEPGINDDELIESVPSSSVVSSEGFKNHKRTG